MKLFARVVSAELKLGKMGEGSYLNLAIGPPTPLTAVHVAPANPADPIIPVDWSKLSPPTQEETEAALARLERKGARPALPVLIDTSHESFVVRRGVQALLDQHGLSARTARDFHFKELVESLGFPPEEAVRKALDRIESDESRLRR